MKWRVRGASTETGEAIDRLIDADSQEGAVAALQGMRIAWDYLAPEDVTPASPPLTATGGRGLPRGLIVGGITITVLIALAFAASLLDRRKPMSREAFFGPGVGRCVQDRIVTTAAGQLTLFYSSEGILVVLDERKGDIYGARLYYNPFDDDSSTELSKSINDFRSSQLLQTLPAYLQRVGIVPNEHDAALMAVKVRGQIAGGRTRPEIEVGSGNGWRCALQRVDKSSISTVQIVFCREGDADPVGDIAF